MEYISFILENGAEIFTALVGVLAALYTLALIIPGEQPDKTIKAILDFTEKVSRKK